MRMTAFILLVCCMHVSARTASQTITLTGKDIPLLKVFEAIRAQTGYVVLTTKDVLSGIKPVSVSARNMPLDAFLELALKNQALTFKISDKTIMLARKSNANVAVERFFDILQAQPPADVSGRITSEGKPVAGAAVVLKPGGRGTTTDNNGAFLLTAVKPGTYTVEITSLGYKKLTAKVEVNSLPVVLNLGMEASVNEQEELVVSTGYSTKKTGELTGAVQKISGDDLRRGITTSDPVSLLKGRAAGLYISEQNAGDPNSSGGQIFVRGQSSIVGVGVDQANEFVMPTQNYGPLLVLDGVIMPNQNLKEIVTPQEIEEITILKDAAATAIYGSRASGGVLVVTTKRGKVGKARITGEVKYGINKPNRGTIRFLTGPELYDLQKRYYTVDYDVNNASLSPSYPTLQAYLDDRLPTQEEVANSYDWQKFAFITSNTKEVNMSASGGNDRSRYYIGAGYYNEQSTGVDNGLKRKTIRFNLDNRLTDRVSLNIAVNGIFNDGHMEFYPTGTYLYSYIPWANPYNADGTLKPHLNYKLDGFDNETDNPLFENQYNYSTTRTQLIFGSARLEYKVTDWLTLSSTNSANLNYGKDEDYIDVRSYNGSGTVFGSKGYLGTNTSYLNSYLTSNQISFHKTFGAHSLRALVATEFGQTRMENIRVNVNNVRAGYPVISLGRLVGGSSDYSIYGITASKAGNIEGGKENRAQFSGFGEVGYTFRDRYSASASLRTDASSSFGADNRYGTFYSVGGAWIISSERFMKTGKWLSNLKVRANYGTSGSQLGDNFLTKTLYRPGYTYVNQGAATISVLGNPNLHWEVTKTLSTGVDIGLFRRVTTSVDLYRRRSEDLLQKISLPALSGFATQWNNVASVQNEGLEIIINSDNIVRNDFRWSMQFNISFNRNEIVKVANDSLRQGFYTANSFYLFKGEDINTLKAVKWAGVDPQTGKPLFEKLIFDDKGNAVGRKLVNTLAEVGAGTDTRQFQTIGSFQPKFYGGWTNTFSYKQFTLSALITYAYKYVITDDLAQQNQGTNITSYNQIAYRSSQKVWTTPGQTDATEPSLYEGANTDYFGSSKYMHDGSHIRLRSVRLSYDLPGRLLRHLGMNSCQLYVSGDNLYTRYSKDIVASDPEGPSVGNAQNFGTSVGSSIAVPRRYVFGLQLNF